jgi:hypothetical protein
MLAGTLKPKPCGYCKSLFTPVRLMQAVCSPICARRQVLAKKVEERTKIKTRREAIKTIPVLIREAQIAFNAFVRERDRQAGHACISSGRPLDWTGNAVDAGHYRSVGAAAHLRFNEDNVHAQSKHDNQYKAGNAVDYRLGLIQRIGLARVEALEASNEPHKWIREELIAIKAMYVRRLKELKQGEQP